jgi:hypothetical protein
MELLTDGGVRVRQQRKGHANISIHMGCFVDGNFCSHDDCGGRKGPPVWSRPDCPAGGLLAPHLYRPFGQLFGLDVATIDKESPEEAVRQVDAIKPGLSGIGGVVAAAKHNVDKEMRRSMVDYGVAP